MGETERGNQSLENSNMCASIIGQGDLAGIEWNYFSIYIFLCLWTIPVNSRKFFHFFCKNIISMYKIPRAKYIESKKVPSLEVEQLKKIMWNNWNTNMTTCFLST